MVPVAPEAGAVLLAAGALGLAGAALCANAAVEAMRTAAAVIELRVFFITILPFFVG
jgi:hypothetical protein